MLNKLTLAAVITAIAMPALAADVNPGRAMQAALLNVDASQFTTSELAQIASEKNTQDRVTRANFIIDENARGVLTAVASDDATGYSANFGLNTHTGRDN